MVTVERLKEKTKKEKFFQCTYRKKHSMVLSSVLGIHGGFWNGFLSDKVREMTVY